MLSRHDATHEAAPEYSDDQPALGSTAQTIVVGTDGSPSSWDAIAFAVELASIHRADVHFVHVIPTLDLVPPITIDDFGAALPHEPTRYDHALLADAATFASERGVVATTALLSGSTTAEVVAYADEHDVDTIIVGSRGHRAVPERAPRERVPGRAGSVEAPGAHRPRQAPLPLMIRVASALEFGLDTFGDATRDADNHPLSHAQTIRNVVEEGVLAEAVGVDFFGIGEHHSNDFPMPAGDVVLAAIAARTSTIHLGSAVTVLSSDDPVRVYQRFSTLDAVSRGRAEVILGRGSSVESFPLFGYDLADYETLFEEKAELFAELVKGGPVTWAGTTRAPLHQQDVVPNVEEGPFPVWIGVGGSPASVSRAARLGFGLMLAIIGGNPAAVRSALGVVP